MESQATSNPQDKKNTPDSTSDLSPDLQEVATHHFNTNTSLGTKSDQDTQDSSTTSEHQKVSQTSTPNLESHGNMIEKDSKNFRQKISEFVIKKVSELDKTEKNTLELKKQSDNSLKSENKRLKEEKITLQKNYDSLKETSDRRISELEATRKTILTEMYALKRNPGTHYDRTSDRPQHHVLTGEYKTLKDQYLDPLVNSLFKFIVANDPELKQQRKEKTHDIKAIISDTMLIGGQRIMKGESTSIINQQPKILDEMPTLLRNKVVVIAQDKLQYSVPGKWQEQDFLQASTELSDGLCQALTLNFTSLEQDLQTEIHKAIQTTLIFLQSAALSDPPAILSLGKEYKVFRNDYHEAAKGNNEEGKISKTVYPAYLVNDEVKVKAVVLTEPLPSYSHPLLPSTNEEKT